MLSRIRPSAQDLLDPTLGGRSGEQHPAAAAQALEADISSQPHDVPLHATTWVGLSELHFIAQTEVHQVLAG